MGVRGQGPGDGQPAPTPQPPAPNPQQEADELALLRSGAEWAPAVALGALREGEVRLCYAAGHPLALALVEDAVYALDGRCPHWGATFVDSALRGDSLRCPLHGFRYDVRSGAATWPAGWPPVATYPTRIEDGMVYVRMGWRCKRGGSARP